MPGSLGTPTPSGSAGAGTFTPGTGRGGLQDIIHAPSTLQLTLRGLYQSVLPDGQAAKINWQMDIANTDYPDGAGPGYCDTILSANLLSLADGDSVDWDLYDLSESGNDIGHGVENDNLGMPQSNARIYSLIVRNWSLLEGCSGALEVGDSGSNEWTPILNTGCKVTLPVDSLFAIIGGPEDGFDIASDNCFLKTKAVGGTSVYGINYIANSE